MASLQHPKTNQTITVPDSVVPSYEAQGWRRPGATVEQPTSKWLNAHIAAFAEREGIDLGGATVKADMLEAIAAARRAE